ncbi:MAG: DNA double-strand break repair nuclease NurA [Chloroflexota bacterium]|nr:DNA double-strand break repair nuclease NurA [Chloroflexota bacterium]
MPLQLEVLSHGMERLAAQASDVARQQLLEEARERLGQIDGDALRARLRTRDPRFPWLTAVPTNDTLGAAYSVPLPSPPFSVVATDGSNIPPDRHSPVRFYVLNIGRATLVYGAPSDARLESTTYLACEEEELYLNPGEENIPIEGARLGIKMAVAELEALPEAARKVHPPALGLLDGSLILWGLQGEERSVQAAFLGDYLSALDKLRQADVLLASYISYPGGQDVANSLRVSLCQDHPSERELCQFLGTVRDREIFSGLLEAGQRSDIFDSTSAILDRYEEHRIQFFYLNNGDEIVRLEAPQWVMGDGEKRDLVQGLVLDQCRRSGGYPSYPPALQEAHEQAVISTGERRLVEEMVAQALADRGITYFRSAKESSKRRRGV